MYHIARDELIEIVASYKAGGLKVGFTSGTFDILHIGHVSYLEKAKELVDKLIVGVNSDSSVREYKGPKRPINGENERLGVVKGLRAVDHAFLFTEKDNKENIAKLRPDYYIKAKDYSLNTLSSAPLVESYGGEVALVDFAKGFSTSDTIDRIIFHEMQISGDEISRKPAPALFLDRDGTLIKEVEYLHEPEKVEILPGVGESLRTFQDAGYRLIIVTNQPGIGFGYFTKEDFFRTNKAMLGKLSRFGVRIDKIYYSPYTTADNTQCRKPNTALVEKAFKELNIIREKSYFIGDMSSDIECGKSAGLKTVLVGSGKGGSDGLYKVTPDIEVKGLGELGEILCQALSTR
jgi:rfaE bifunctional protein nucleotidyltransferase chain/domain